MLRIILNWLKGKAEELLPEEQAGFRPKRSTNEQIFKMRLLIEKHVYHHQDLYHNFIDFKKACDHVWHKRLWRVMRSYSIHKGLVKLLELVYRPSTSAVLHEGEIIQSFRTSIRVYAMDAFCRQCCSTYTLKISCKELYTTSVARYR